MAQKNTRSQQKTLLNPHEVQKVLKRYMNATKLPLAMPEDAVFWSAVNTLANQNSACPLLRSDWLAHHGTLTTQDEYDAYVYLPLLLAAKCI